MKNKTLIISFFLFSVLILTSCWNQYDIITILNDGTIEFVTTTEIIDKEFTYNDVEELSEEFLKALRASGWIVKKEWIKKEFPFNMRFVGNGNIKRIHNNSDFYHIKKVTEKEYQIAFIPAEAQGGQSSRSIILSGRSLPLYKNGKEIRKIDNVFGDQYYTIFID